MSENTILTTFSITLNDEGISRLINALGVDYVGTSTEHLKQSLSLGRVVASIRYGVVNKLDYLREPIPELSPWEGK